MKGDFFGTAEKGAGEPEEKGRGAQKDWFPAGNDHSSRRGLCGTRTAQEACFSDTT